MTKVCLINPPSPFLLDERVFMPIGVLKIAAYLEKQGMEVDFLDLAGVVNDLEVVLDYMQKNDTKHFGITATTPQYKSAVSIAKTLRGYKENTVTLGGPHVSLINSAVKKRSGRATNHFIDIMKNFDNLVFGDGEKAYENIIRTNKDKNRDADDPKSEYWLTNQDLDGLPLPARHLIDIDSYKYEIDNEDSISIICQLGCPFNCQFCGGRNSPFLRRIRSRSVSNIVDEIGSLYYTYGKTGFMFYDDELNVSKSFKDMLRALIDLQETVGQEFRFRGFLKSELLDEEQADLMYKAGFRWVLTGFESGDPRVLKNIEKKATVEDNTRFMQIAHKYGLKVKALMSIGHAGETANSVQNTTNWLLENKPDDFDCTIITPYPGSPYYDDAKQSSDGMYYVYEAKNGDRLYQNDVDYSVEADYYKGDPDGGYISHVWTDTLSKEDLVKERESVETEVRSKLNIPYPKARKSILYEHSMGQSIPSNILRSNIVEWLKKDY